MSLKESIKAAQIDLIKELGINDLPQEQREETLTQMSEVIQQRIVLRIVEELPADKKEGFADVVNNSAEEPEAIDTFLTENLPNVEELVLEEIGKYKAEMLEFVSKSADKETDPKEAIEEGEE
ncbi:hypothetical protein HN784_01120 [bacterium]|jgi:hypothetical protein|nr:hypothetical protein [bacterium]MBT4251678.1 hypothetical protein [bacterium]MBT4597728.1 hypothetical protein [bacterium]MBT6753740.1 hypothetical protein [bacterium]MBT7037877.1 hypothetical protein [bacterium]